MSQALGDGGRTGNRVRGVGAKFHGGEGKRKKSWGEKKVGRKKSWEKLGFFLNFLKQSFQPSLEGGSVRRAQES